MDSNTPKELIEILKESLKRAEPYPIEYLDDLGYDDPRLKDDYPEKDRITATMAKKYMIEHGIPIDEE